MENAAWHARVVRQPVRGVRTLQICLLLASQLGCACCGARSTPNTHESDTENSAVRRVAQCSWFSQCNKDALTTLPSLKSANGASYRTVQVKTTALPAPAFDPCVGMHFYPREAASTPLETSAAEGGASDELAKLTTIFVSGSPRPSDQTWHRGRHVPGDEPWQASLRAVESARTALGLRRSRAVLVFDGATGRGQKKVEEEARMRHALARKVEGAVHAAAGRGLDVAAFDTWMHQANALRCAMRVVPRTRLVFSIQEDTQARIFLVAREGSPVDIDISPSDPPPHTPTRASPPTHSQHPARIEGRGREGRREREREREREMSV